MANGESLGPKGLVARFFLAILVVFATFNPWAKSFYHWAVQPVFATGGGIGTLGPIKVLAGLLLLVGWIVCVQATHRSIGLKGALLVAAILATVVWLLLSRHLLSAENSKSIALIALIIISGILAVGMSWSHISRKLSGQVDTDQVA